MTEIDSPVVICKHGMNVEWCGYCNEPDPPRKPARRERSTVNEKETISIGWFHGRGEAIVHTNVREAQNTSFLGLDPTTHLVHIDGCPNLWAIEKILEQCPNLKTIQITPRSGHHLKKRHRELCENRNVEIRLGYWNPLLAWPEGENRSPYFRQQREFLKTLPEGQRLEFEELIELGFEDALITARYFCLKDEPYLAQREICTEFGLPQRETSVSVRVNAVLFYLDPTFECGENAKRRGMHLRRRVRNLKLSLQQSEYRKKLLDDLGLTELPHSVPMSKLECYRAISLAIMSGELERIAALKPKVKIYEVMCLRYGLGMGSTSFQTLEQVAEKVGVTRERVRQIELVALKMLGLEDLLDRE